MQNCAQQYDIVFIFLDFANAYEASIGTMVAKHFFTANRVTIGITTLRRENYSAEILQRMKNFEEVADTLIRLFHPKNALAVKPSVYAKSVEIMGTAKTTQIAMAQAALACMELFFDSGLISLSLIDFCSTIWDKKAGVMGFGCAQGQGRAQKATELALQNLPISPEQQTGVASYAYVIKAKDVSAEEMSIVKNIVSAALPKGTNALYQVPYQSNDYYTEHSRSVLIPHDFLSVSLLILNEKFPLYRFSF